jgi:uncharacterized SAM-dependent methyltransferase
MSFEQDYIDLFLKKRSGHMAQYVHMYRPHIYEELIKQDFYYPFKMERDLITACADKLGATLQGITEVLELGPGSRTPIVSKTVPFLKILRIQSPISAYKAIDATREYAEQACHIVQEHFHDIQTEALEINFLSPNAFKKINEGSNTKGRKLIVGFGQPFFANNNDKDIVGILENISSLMGREDYLLFGADMSDNESRINSAYNTKFGHELLLNVMYYLKKSLGLEVFDPRAFDSIHKWNASKRYVELSLKAKKQQSFKISDHEIIIEKDDYFNLFNSKKPSLELIKNYLQEANMIIKDVIFPSNASRNKFRFILVQRTSPGDPLKTLAIK